MVDSGSCGGIVGTVGVSEEEAGRNGALTGERVRGDGGRTRGAEEADSTWCLPWNGARDDGGGWREKYCDCPSSGAVSVHEMSRTGRLLRRRSDGAPANLSISPFDAVVVGNNDTGDWVSVPSSRCDKLDGRAELGVRGSWGSELSRTARSVARRATVGLLVAREEEGREEEGEGTSKECLSCLSKSASWAWAGRGFGWDTGELRAASRTGSKAGI